MGIGCIQATGRIDFALLPGRPQAAKNSLPSDKHRVAPKQGPKQMIFTRDSVSINLEPIRESWTDSVCQLPYRYCATNDLGLLDVSQLEVM